MLCWWVLQDRNICPWLPLPGWYGCAHARPWFGVWVCHLLLLFERCYLCCRLCRMCADSCKKKNQDDPPLCGAENCMTHPLQRVQKLMTHPPTPSLLQPTPSNTFWPVPNDANRGITRLSANVNGRDAMMVLIWMRTYPGTLTLTTLSKKYPPASGLSEVLEIWFPVRPLYWFIKLLNVCN